MLKQLQPILNSEIDPAFRLRAWYILEEIEKEKPKTVLETGCGRGFYMHSLTFFPDIKEIHGIDVNDKYLAVAKKHITDKRVHLRNASIYELPYPDNSFDAVICSEVLEHLSDDAAALKEIRRVLKKNGVLLVSVPNQHFSFLWDPLNWLLMKIFNTHVHKDIWWLAGIWADHERLYTREQLREVVEDAKFKIERTEMVVTSCWPFSHFALYGIGKNIVERLGASAFDRFNFEEKPLSKALAAFMRWPTTWWKSEQSSVNIFVKLRK